MEINLPFDPSKGLEITSFYRSVPLQARYGYAEYVNEAGPGGVRMGPASNAWLGIWIVCAYNAKPNLETLTSQSLIG